MKKGTPDVPREDWLASPDPDVFVRAITLCTSGDPSWCSASGRCRNDGECFPGGRIVHERRELRHHVGELIRLGRELRARLRALGDDRRLRIAPRTCVHCGRDPDVETPRD